MESGLTFEKVWAMFQETDKKFQETDKKLKESDKKFQEELEKGFQRVWDILEKSAKERKKEARETKKKLRELEGLFTGQWGKLMESLVEGDIINLLNQRGISINQTAQRIKKFYNGREYEIDIIAKNGEEIVFIEVKTTLYPRHVTSFLETLSLAKELFSEYKNLKIYGAVAFLRAESEAVSFAFKNGLFVIRATGKSSSILNPPDFQPKIF